MNFVIFIKGKILYNVLYLKDMKTIAVIDLKAFYSYVECVDRGLDPWKTPLVVADIERSPNTIILSVTPYLKQKGIPSRLRIKDLPKGIDYIYAVPRMSKYIEMSTKVVSILLDFVSSEDMHVYSIDEAFVDLTTYLDYYKKSPKEIVRMMIDKITEETGLMATAGIGDNFFLAKAALDLYAKKEKDGIAIMHKEDVESKLWPITPLSKMWGIGQRLERRLNNLGIFSVGQLAKSNRDFMRSKFGIIGDQLVDCANGIDESDIREEYIPKENSLSIGQTLPKNYSSKEARTVITELIDDLSLRLRNEKYKTEVVALSVGYASNRGGFSHQMSLLNKTDDTEILKKAIFEIYNQYIEDEPIRRLYVSFGKLSKTTKREQLSLFMDYKTMEDNHNLQMMIDNLHNKYGKDIVMRASAMLEESTAKERHNMIGGHRK